MTGACLDGGEDEQATVAVEARTSTRPRRMKRCTIVSPFRMSLHFRRSNSWTRLGLKPAREPEDAAARHEGDTRRGGALQSWVLGPNLPDALARRGDEARTDADRPGER